MNITLRKSSIYNITTNTGANITARFIGDYGTASGQPIFRAHADEHIVPIENVRLAEKSDVQAYMGHRQTDLAKAPSLDPACAPAIC